MKIEKIKDRNVIFRFGLPDWDLNLHLILGNRNNYVIDTGLGTLSIEPIKEYLRDDCKPIVVINTHYHWDHTWGNHAFHDCTIISHRICREIMESKWDEMMEENEAYIRGEAQICLPNLVFEDTLNFPDDKIKLMYTPGHTVDCISVLDEQDKVLNAGDNIGDTLEEIIPSIECEKSVYAKTLLQYKAMDFDTCVSGHNTILGKEVIDLILNRYM